MISADTSLDHNAPSASTVCLRLYLLLQFTFVVGYFLYASVAEEKYKSAGFMLTV